MILTMTYEEALLYPEPKMVVLTNDIATVLTAEDMGVSPTFPTVLEAWQFRDRFTTAELVAILTLANGGDVNAQLLLLKVQTATSGIDMSSSSVIMGVNYLESKGVIGAGRSAVILS